MYFCINDSRSSLCKHFYTVKKIFTFLQIPPTQKNRVVENFISELSAEKNKTFFIESTKGYFSIDGHRKDFVRYQDALDVVNDIEKGILGLHIKSIQWQVYQNNKVGNEHRAII